jgi:hypothetical protein
VDHVIEAGRLVTLVSDVSNVLVDLGTTPIPEITWDPHMATDILEVVDVILELLKEAYNFDHEPWD